jgi:type IV pilus assembly protein PilW
MTFKKITEHPYQSGFTLVEMMIAMTIGLLIILALSTVIIGAGASSRATGGQSELQTNGRYALDVIKRDVQQAGYYGLRGRGIENSTVPVAQDCLLGFATNISQRVWGSNNGINPFSVVTCPELANVQPNTDMLVLRYLGTGVRVAAVAGPVVLPDCATATGALCYRSSYKAGNVFAAGSTPPADLAVPLQDHTVEVSLYYVNRNTVGADGIPSLRKYALSKTGVMTDELVVSGVENFQVQYGVDAGLTKQGDPTNTQYSDAQDVNSANPLVFAMGAAMAAPAGTGQTVAGAQQDAIASAVNKDGVSTTAWGNVNSVRLWLLVKNGTAEAAPYRNTTTYTIGDINYTPPAGDRFRRQVFTSTIQMRN